MNNTIPITPEGLHKLNGEKMKLLEKRPRVVESLRIAREMGDLSENAAYKVARMELTTLDSRLRHLHRLIINSRVVVSAKTGRVEIGSKVKLKKDQKVITYQIVGSFESQPSEGKISHLSPIGKALIGRKAGDQVTINTPMGVAVYEIIEVE